MGRDLVSRAVIPVTAELVAAYDDAAWENPVRIFGADVPNVRAGLAAVLAIVARDHLRPAPGPDRCSACGRTARHLLPVTELVDGRTTVVARLGPSCHQRAMDASARGRQALPIGDTQ
jgi:hypothetical protein